MTEPADGRQIINWFASRVLSFTDGFTEKKKSLYELNQSKAMVYDGRCVSCA